MNRRHYKEMVLRIISDATSIPFWSSSDYLDPIRKLHSNSRGKDRKELRLAVLELLHQQDYLDPIIDVCREIQLIEACEKLLELFFNPPQQNEGHRVWIDGFRRHIVATLGGLGCTKAEPFLESLLSDAVHQNRRSKLPRLSSECYGVALSALAQLAPMQAARYFGWWLEVDQEIQQRHSALARSAEGWRALSKLGFGQLLDKSASLTIQNCILPIAKKGRLPGLRRWLRSVSLSHEKSRIYLREQLTYMLKGDNPLANLKKLIPFQGNPASLADQLASLPSADKSPLNRGEGHHT